MSILNYIFDRALAHVKRYNNRLVTSQKSVAEHSFYTTNFSDLLLVLVEQKGHKVDATKTLRMAIRHDEEEGFSGDILNPFKHYNPETEEAIRKVNEETINKMYEELPQELSTKFVTTWHSEQDRSQIEAQIVKVADILSLLSECYEEIKVGNKDFQEIYSRQLRDLKKLDYSWWVEIRDEVLSGAEKEVESSHT